MTDKLRDMREWGTFVLSGLAVIAIPIGVLVLNNQRLQIEKSVAETYISKYTYHETTTRLDATDAEIWRKVGEMGGKLDLINMNMVRMEGSLSSMKESMRNNERTTPK